MTTLILTQIPYPHITPAITTYQLPLIRMYDNVIHRHAVHVVALHVSAPRIPDLDRAIL
jgi:hypothetical protein